MDIKPLISPNCHQFSPCKTFPNTSWQLHLPVTRQPRLESVRIAVITSAFCPRLGTTSLDLCGVLKVITYQRPLCTSAATGSDTHPLHASLQSFSVWSKRQRVLLRPSTRIGPTCPSLSAVNPPWKMNHAWTKIAADPLLVTQQEVKQTQESTEESPLVVLSLFCLVCFFTFYLRTLPILR